MTTVTAAAWVAWAISNRLKIFDFQTVKGEGFDWSPRSLAKGVAFAA
jgi:hypothetical protein